MIKNKTAWLILGFVLFLLGSLSIILMLVGVQFSFMKWLDFNGRGLGLLLRILLIMTGMIMIFISRSSDYD